MAAMSLDHVERLVEMNLDLAAVGLRDGDLVAVAAEIRHHSAGLAAAADALLRSRLGLRGGVAGYRLLRVLVRGAAVLGLGRCSRLSLALGGRAGERCAAECERRKSRSYQHHLLDAI